MRSAAEIFLSRMETLFGFEPEFYKGETANDGLPTPSVMVFKNVPDPGYMTCVTYGLSLCGHPKWTQQRRPELIMTVNSRNIVWAITLADMITEMRGKFPFSYGQTITYPDKITEQSQLNSFLLFAPAILDTGDYMDIDVGEPYKICLTGIYPVSKQEIQFINDNGLEKFWKQEDLDYLNVYR
jgi:hypothetical protein